MEFHIARSVRERLGVPELLFSYTGNVVFANVAAARRLALAISSSIPPATGHPQLTPLWALIGVIPLLIAAVVIVCISVSRPADSDLLNLAAPQETIRRAWANLFA